MNIRITGNSYLVEPKPGELNSSGQPKKPTARCTAVEVGCTTEDRIMLYHSPEFGYSAGQTLIDAVLEPTKRFVPDAQGNSVLADMEPFTSEHPVRKNADGSPVIQTFHNRRVVSAAALIPATDIGVVLMQAAGVPIVKPQPRQRVAVGAPLVDSAAA